MTPDDVRLIIIRTGLSQAGVAEIAGVKPDTAGKWVAGKLMPLPEHVDRLRRLNAKQDAMARAIVAAASDGDAALGIDLGAIGGMPGAGARLAVARRVADIVSPRDVMILDARS